jgi:hypothetical protein
MKRSALLLALFALLLGACSTGEESPRPDGTPDPEPQLEVEPEQLPDGLLELSDIGEGWTEDEDPEPSTVQIGGQVGPANLKTSEAEAISAFEETDGSGYITNNLFLLVNADTAHEWIELHRHGHATKTWVQDREDGGTATNKNNGPIEDLPALGDEMYTARIAVTIEDGDGVKTERRVHYVVYRVDRLLSFVIAQDADAAVFARRQESRVARLTS